MFVGCGNGSFLAIHYGSPLVTRSNTVIVAVNTGVTNGFQIEALAGATVMVVRTGVAVTVTLAVPFTLPLDAVTVKGPPVVEPAVNKPDELMEPPPLTDQVNVGCGLIGLPN